jgi:hypothetical protein
MGIALPWMCALISLWVSGAKTNSGIAITKLNHQHREGIHQVYLDLCPMAAIIISFIIWVV